MRLRVAPIVEGHGEVDSIRILLRRLGSEMLHADYVDVLQPIRIPRSKLLKEQELARALGLAVLKLSTANELFPEPVLILVLIDADEDASCVLAPRLVAQATQAHPHMNIACVLPNKEYESWFVACAASLSEFLSFDDGELPADPETVGKGWVERHFSGGKYSETVDQPKMTARMDLAKCRSASYSFDKLCRELEKVMAGGRG